MEEKILEFILEYAEEQKLVPFSVIEEEFNLVMDDSLKSVIADVLWDNDTVSDVFIETDGLRSLSLKIKNICYILSDL